MAAELGLQSLTHLAQSHQNKDDRQLNLWLTPGSWKCNSMQGQEDEDSWEVRAFAEDTGNIMGTTWPPRSYTCTFCRREFRSAQALGGHMNVHRRDRARALHQAHPNSNNYNSASSSSSSSIVIPAHELVADGGLCLLYQLPSPNDGRFSPPTTSDACNHQSPSSLLSISAYPPSSFMTRCSPSMNCPAVLPVGKSSSQCHIDRSAKNLPCAENSCEELDLELRLGNRPMSS